MKPKVIKERETKAYLIISSVHLGANNKILSTFQRIKEFYNAETIHLGRLVTQEEKDMYDRRMYRVKTWEKEDKEAKSAFKSWHNKQKLKHDNELATLKSQKDQIIANKDLDAEKKRELKADIKEKISKLIREFNLRVEKYEIKTFKCNEQVRERVLDEIELLKSAQQGRVETLTDHFGPVRFVLNNELCIPCLQNYSNIAISYNQLSLSRFLFLSAVSANGEKINESPITKRSLRYFKAYGKSWIAPHPIPAIESFPREGLNQAYNYITTGSLRDLESPLRPSDYYKCSHLPAAVLVLVDLKNGEFHLKQMHVDYIRKPGQDKSTPVVLDDGMLFTPTEYKYVESNDKATHVTDDHAPHYHPGVLGALRQLNTLHQPETLFNGGDAADFGSVCRHTKGIPGEREGLRLKDDLDILRKLLTAQASIDTIKVKLLLDSNHADWLTNFVKENPSLLDMLDWESLAKSMFADWSLIIRDLSGDTRICRFGDMVIRHGDQERGAVDASELFSKYLGGHWHRFKVHRRAISVGPGCALGLRYLGNKLTAWQNQITSITKYYNVAAASPKIVLHDENRQVSRFAYQNKIFEVPYFFLEE